ncbi:MAG TPA: hypothetical protein VMH90_00310, partial [Thermoplasmata archaeon]|nr:hypothetical protein [Thermoplasmata archaeon]
MAVYLLPAVVGAGRGDIEDLRAVGELLRPTGVPLFLPVGTLGAPELPAGERRAWTFARPERRLVRRARRALAILPQFGVTGAPGHPGPFGRPGPWARVIEELERLYGADRVVLVSLEEFARNLSAARQESERRREGGVTRARLRAVRRTRAWTRDVARMRRLWRKYHALDRPNLLHLVPTFRGSAACRRDFPELLECGPIPPPPTVRRSVPPRTRVDRRVARWVWYASPSTSPLLVDGLARGSRRARRRLEIALRTPRPFPARRPPGPLELRPLEDAPRAQWERTFREAELRIVTGSRSLLEALALGGPFLYFHGATGTGARRKAHRPE